MGLNTYPANPFPPSTDQMDADALEAEVSKLNSGLTNKQDKTDNTLMTTDKTVVGAINEVDGKLTSYTLTPATDVTINRASCVKIMNTVIVDAVVTLGADKSASSTLLTGLPTIGSTNIPIYAVDDNATSRPVRVYASGVYTSGTFVASERIHIMGCYTLTD